MKNFSAVVVSAGKGQRFGGRKQFSLVGGIPLFFHSYLAFQNLANIKELVYVVDLGELDQYSSQLKQLAKSYPLTLPYQFVDGGKERYQSVWNGLKKCDSDHVFIHDAARPLVRKSDLTLLIEALNQRPKSVGVVPVGPLYDSIKKINIQDEITENLDRSKLVATSTPQGFNLAHILKASSLVDQKRIPTDDAEIFIRAGFSIQGVWINHPNPKITYPQDLEVAQAIYLRDEIHKERLKK